MRLKKYLYEKEKVDINYGITNDKELGIYVQTISTQTGFERQGLATKKLIEIFKKNPKNHIVTFSSPMSKGGKALANSLVKKGILNPIDGYNNKFKINKQKIKESIIESLIIRDQNDKIIGKKNIKFTKKNIEKIAYNYDAEIEKFEQDMNHAILKDSRGRLLFVDSK